MGVLGSTIEAAWQDWLTKLGVNNAKTRDVIRQQAVKKTLELSDVILRQFHVATHTSPEWALHALSHDI
jgi:capsid protein